METNELPDESPHTAPQRLARLPGPTLGLALWAGSALVLLGAHLIRPFGRPARTVSAMLDALSSGDGNRLRTEEGLGFQHRAEREIRSRGETEYARVLSIFEKEERLGEREYRRIRRTVAQLGDKEFRRLSRDDQRTVREFSHRHFVADKGWAQLSDEERKTIGSIDVIADRGKLRTLAVSLGQAELMPEEQAQLAGKDPSAPEVIKDRKLAKLFAAAEKSGMDKLAPTLSTVDTVGGAELAKLPRRDRDRIESDSFNQWIYDAGLKAADDAMRAKVNVAQLADDESPEAGALRRGFGARDLEAESRKQLDGLDYDKFVAAHKLFVEIQGGRLWGEQLRTTFTPGCCSMGKSRYLGDSGRSLLRNSAATVALEFGPPPPPPPKARDKKGARAEATEDEEIEKVHPAKKYLGSTVVLDYRWGSWVVVDFDSRSDGEAGGKGGHGDEAMKAAMGALSSLGAGGGIASFFLFGAIGAAVLLIVLWKRKAPVIAAPEALIAAAVLALAALQTALEGQVSLDDLIFTPLYLALPIWVGARRGAESGFVGGFLAGLALLVVSSVGGIASYAAAAGDHLLLGEHLLAVLFLAATGALAGRVRWPAELPVAIPLLWILYFATIDRSQLASLACYAHLFLAAAVTGAGILLERLDLLRSVARVWQPEGEASEPATS